jgi:heme exporter protein C
MAMLSVFANPARFLALSNWLAPLLYAASLALIGWGLWQGLWVVPPDEYQAGDVMRVMFIHVPAAWLSMASYSALAICSFIWFIWRHELADVAAKAIAPLGATWTALCLATGAIWGKPTWGTWWEWGDARMMSVLFLFFLFLGYIALRAAMDSRQKAQRAGAILAMVGILNVPLIKFSVDLFTSLHQDSQSVITSRRPENGRGLSLASADERPWPHAALRRADADADARRDLGPAHSAGQCETDGGGLRDHAAGFRQECRLHLGLLRHRGGQPGPDHPDRHPTGESLAGKNAAGRSAPARR